MKMEESLNYIAAKEEYDRLRDYCVPCKGAGHFHILLELDGMMRPQNIPCTPCNGIGYSVRQNYSILKNLFEEKNKPFKIYVKNKIAFINSFEEDVNRVEDNNDNTALIQRIYLFEKIKTIKKGVKNTHK